jgi:predicted TIM-barrel fold metal-dependent hydrolase
VIDFHTHVFPDSIASRAMTSLSDGCGIKPSFDGTCSGLKDSMEKAGINISVHMPVVTKPSQTRNANEWAMQTQNDNILAFGALHPQNSDWRDEIDLIINFGLKGVKMHPDYQNFFVDEPRMLLIYEYILERGLILLFHAGVDIGLPAPYHCTPHRLLNVINAMQGGVIVASHLGGHAMWDDVERYLVGRNIYFDTSMGLEYYSIEQLKRIIDSHGYDKILFGTDAPWSDQNEELSRMKNAGLNVEQLDAVLYNNASFLLKFNT